MSELKLPLSGNVNQVINPWSFGPLWSVGPISVSLGDSSNLEAEKEVLTSVASYGRQLGRIEDVLVVLLRRLLQDGLRAEALNDEERKAIKAFQGLLADIAHLKKKHGANPALQLRGVG